MAIESDQLVFDYLSRVGDLAQSRQLPSGVRMRLVSELRAEIDRRRAQASGDSPAVVRKLLARMGKPEEVVARAAEREGGASRTSAPGPDPEPVAPSPAPAPAPAPQRQFVPEQRTTDEPATPSAVGNPDDSGDSAVAKLRRKMPRPRLSKPAPPHSGSAGAAGPAAPGVSPTAASPPHLAGEDELGPSGSEPDWWRVDASPFGVADSVPGFVGGVEIPEILKPPPEKDQEGEQGAKDGVGASADDEKAGEAEDAEGAEEEGESGRRRRLFRRSGGLRAVSSGLTNPLLLIAAAVLVAGAVLGNWIVLGVGWALAYTSRRLTLTERKFAVLGLPGLVAASGVVWLWGRLDRRWGEAVPKGGMADALADTWPWVVRGAAVASALFVVWRSQRQRAE